MSHKNCLKNSKSIKNSDNHGQKLWDFLKFQRIHSIFPLSPCFQCWNDDSEVPYLLCDFNIEKGGERGEKKPIFVRVCRYLLRSSYIKELCLKSLSRIMTKSLTYPILPKTIPIYYRIGTGRQKDVLKTSLSSLWRLKHVFNTSFWRSVPTFRGLWW